MTSKPPKNKAKRAKISGKPSPAEDAGDAAAPPSPAPEDAPAVAVKPSPALVDAVNEGQRLLRAVPGSLSQIAAAVGVKSKQTVKSWRDGLKSPNAVQRAALERAFQIPPAAWSMRPDGAIAPTNAPAMVTGKLLPTMAEVNALIEIIKAMLDDPKLLPSEKTKGADTLSKALSLRARLEEKAEFLEDRIVREHPGFRRMLDKIIGALQPHPEAMRAVVAELEQQTAAVGT